MFALYALPSPPRCPLYANHTRPPGNPALLPLKSGLNSNLQARPTVCPILSIKFYRNSHALPLTCGRRPLQGEGPDWTDFQKTATSTAGATPGAGQARRAAASSRRAAGLPSYRKVWPLSLVFGKVERRKIRLLCHLSLSEAGLQHRLCLYEAKPADRRQGRPLVLRGLASRPGWRVGNGLGSPGEPRGRARPHGEHSSG